MVFAVAAARSAALRGESPTICSPDGDRVQVWREDGEWLAHSTTLTPDPPWIDEVLELLEVHG
jgi:hypothetical protein